MSTTSPTASWRPRPTAARPGRSIGSRPASPTPQLYSFACPTAATCYAAGEDSIPQQIGNTYNAGSAVVAVTQDGGRTWSRVSFPVPADVPGGMHGDAFMDIGSIQCPQAGRCVALGLRRPGIEVHAGVHSQRLAGSPGESPGTVREIYVLRIVSREFSLDRCLSRDYYRDMSSDDATDAPPQPPEDPRIRKITDARTLRALAHPVRIALFEELAMGGAMTATQIGERIGESATTCSFHLRQLAKYGFVEEAGGGTGRSRPWRLTSIGMSFSPSGDTEAEIASDAVVRMFRQRQFDRYETWRSTKASYPLEWRQAAVDGQYLFYLTPAGARAVQQRGARAADALGPARRPAGGPVQAPGRLAAGGDADPRPPDRPADVRERPRRCLG